MGFYLNRLLDLLFGLGDTVQVYMDAYMAALAGRHVRAEFRISAQAKGIPDVEVLVSIGGATFDTNKSLSALSSGQRQRFELALRLAKADLLSERKRVRFNIMFFDEVGRTMSSLSALLLLCDFGLLFDGSLEGVGAFAC